ncbi:MAG: 3-oxoacyl-[acyl-carrier-protein] reductase [Planctomycetota bacterium]
MTLADRAALVTGASRGIGQAIAVSLARAGARVFCTSTREGGCAATLRACAEAGGTAEELAVDVSDPRQVEAAAATVLAAVPQIDVLINNAGVTKDGPFLRMSDADLDSVLAVNLRGSFTMCRVLARQMAKARWGRIVNVGSVVGLTGNAGQVNYAASKAALIGMTKSLARELAPRGVTANVVAPGFVETDMTASLGEDLRDQARKNIPLGRFGTPQDVAATVCFLCSDDAAYITGQVLVVDGGMTM